MPCYASGGGDAAMKGTHSGIRFYNRYMDRKLSLI